MIITHKQTSWGKLLPAFFAFIVMGFVDIIGVATGYIQIDFKLTSFIAQFLPMMVLLWFFVLAVPSGVLQDKYGKKNMLMIGMVIQAAGLGLPFIHYSFAMMFASFILLGIGNTIIQVSANPLMQDVAPGDKLASFLSTSQFVKAIISFSGPLIAAFMASRFGDWRLVLAVYGYYITSWFVLAFINSHYRIKTRAQTGHICIVLRVAEKPVCGIYGFVDFSDCGS
jgi:MFS transporter, FHS family, L-fucose permease